MKALERRCQIRIDDMRIDHRGREIAVTRGLLHQANIFGLPVEFRGKRVLLVPSSA
jgi:hypothetical protein